MTDPKRISWLALLFFHPFFSAGFSQEPGGNKSNTTTKDDISRLIEEAATPHHPVILFGGDFGVFGTGELRHKQIADRVLMISGRLTEAQEKERLAPATQELIKIGEPALSPIHEKIKSSKISDPALPNLVDALNYIGNQETIGILIEKYQQAEEAVRLIDAPGIKAKTDRFTISKLEQKCVLAIWNLTGRQHAFKPSEWSSWWKELKPYYAARQKSKTRFDKSLLEKSISVLPSNPDEAQTRIAREQVVILGRSVLPELQDQLRKTQSTKSGNNLDLVYNLSWCIDELGGVSKLSPRQRNSYFIRRFSRKHKFLLPPIERDARLRALFHCTLADLSSIVISVDGKGLDPINSITSHFHSLFAPFRLKYLAYKRDYYGTVPPDFDNQHRKYGYVSGLSHEQVKTEVDKAVPILVKAIRSENANASFAAARLSNYIGMISPEAPQELVEALRDQWLKNGEYSRTYGSAMVRFDSPVVTAALRQGLFSKHESIVRTSANYANKSRFPPDQNPKVYARLVELVEHPSPGMRFATVRTLRNAKPELLKPFLHQLSRDPNDDVVEEVCYAIDKMKNPMFAEVLVEIAMDESRKEQVRSTAIGRLGKRHFDSSVDEIKPLLQDKKLHGFALNAFYHAKGKKALPILMDFIKKNPGKESIATQYLPRLTGLKFKTPAQWLEWWNKQLQ